MKVKFSVFLISFFLLFSFSLAQGQAPKQRHHAGVFLGAASNLNNGDVHMAAGLDYEFIFPSTRPVFGIGMIMEFVFAEHMETVLALPIYVHPYKGLKAWIAPGAAIPEGGATHFLFRFGAGYDFHLGKITLTPQMSYDQVKCCGLLVYGVGLGFAF